MVSGNGGFRTDVNGLRAWAVLAVVLYHFGVPGFASGYVGVDIFFVISGFLMTGIIWRAIEGDALQKPGAFLWRFYLARGKRILPALLVLCAGVLAAGYFMLSAPEFTALGEQANSAVLFYSNMKFWRETGYFSPGVFNIWLMHTWSLSVEWQFYLVLPVAMLAIAKVRATRRTLIVVLALGAALSLGLCLFEARLKPSTAFFLLPCRAWEMIAGGLVALGALHPPRSLALRRALGWLGLAMIAYAVLAFGHLVWPDWHALVPVVGTMLVLVAAQQSSPLTNWAPLQYTGRISYSMYLWHWPLATGLHYMELQHDPLAIACALGLTFALGHLSYTLVETRLRQPLERMPRAAVSAALACAVVAIVVPALVIARAGGYPQRFTPEVNAMFAAAHGNTGPSKCQIMENGNDSGCMAGGDKLSVIVMGDSHAGATFGAVQSALPDASMGALNWSRGACPSMLGMKSVRDYQLRCDEFLDWSVRRLASIPGDVPVVIINRTALYLEGPNEEGLEQDVAVPNIYFSTPYSERSAAFQREVGDRIVETACTIAKHRTVYMMRPVPEMRVNVPNTLARAMITGRQRDISVPLGEYAQRNKLAMQAQDAAHARCGVQILDPLPYLCKNGRCAAVVDGKALYTDDNHLNSYGRGFLVPMFSPIFAGAAKLPTLQQAESVRTATR